MLEVLMIEAVEMMIIGVAATDVGISVTTTEVGVPMETPSTEMMLLLKLKYLFLKSDMVRHCVLITVYW